MMYVQTAVIWLERFVTEAASGLALPVLTTIHASAFREDHADEATGGRDEAADGHLCAASRHFQ